MPVFILQCESLVEDYEDEMVSMFRLDPEDLPNIEKVICTEISGELLTRKMSKSHPAYFVVW